MYFFNANQFLFFVCIYIVKFNSFYMYYEPSKNNILYTQLLIKSYYFVFKTSKRTQFIKFNIRKLMTPDTYRILS